MGCKVLCPSVALLAYLMICQHIRAQCTQPSFASRNVILTPEYFSTQSFSDGSTVTFQCEIGHRPVNSGASKSVTCQGTQWTNLELNCTRKSCGSLQDFLNGRYEMNGILFGDTAKPVCNKGYMLAGKETTRTCRDGRWDGRDPVCEPVKCSPPLAIENGELVEVPLESYDYLAAVSYRCNPGLNLIGQSTLHCSEDGTFKPDPPKCFDGCPTPTVTNAKRIGGKSPPYKLGNFIEYKCEDGYEMKGEPYIVCRANGWDPEEPSCNALSTTTTTPAVTSKKALSTTTTTTAVTSTVSITSKKGKTDENTKDSSFPTWAIVVICVVLGIVVAVVSLVYVNYRKKRSEHVKVEKEEDQPLQLPHTLGLYEAVLDEIQGKNPANIYIVYKRTSQNPARGKQISFNKFLHNHTQCCFKKTSLNWNNSLFAVSYIFSILSCKTDLSPHNQG